MNTIRSFVAASFCILAATAQAQSAAESHKGHSMSGSDKGSQQMMSSMMSGMKDMQSMQMTGDIDQDFAKMMRMHHQKGIEMAQVEVNQGKDAKMKAMAGKIIESQGKENKEFDEWLSSRK